MTKSVEIISLIYKSEIYLKFICDQMKHPRNQVEGYDIKLRIVANDPNDKVLAALPNCGLPYYIYNDHKPDDYYLNRVYRCWNAAGQTSEADIICFINSDMAFSDKWLHNLLKHHDGKNIVTSRLVESGRMPSGTHGISKYFGRHPIDFNDFDWQRYASEISEDRLVAGGLYMPVLFDRSRFVEAGCFPEGNIYTTGVGMFGKGTYLRSGDEFFFNQTLRKYQMRHVTAFDSIVYHFQSGEMEFDGE